MKLVELKPAQKHHRIDGKLVPIDIYDTDVLLRLILKLSKRCNKFGLKHTKSVDIDDGGVWVARGFVKTKKSKNGSPWEISVMDNSPLIAAEKFLTMLTEHEEKYNVYRQKLDTPSTNSPNQPLQKKVRTPPLKPKVNLITRNNKMVKVSNKSARRKAKFGEHPAIAVKNKLRKMAKHFKKHPNDKQTGSKL